MQLKAGLNCFANSLRREAPSRQHRVEADGLRAKLVIGFSSYVVLYFVTEGTVDIARVSRGGPELDQIALNAS
jgi:hypothetical protein